MTHYTPPEWMSHFKSTRHIYLHQIGLSKSEGGYPVWYAVCKNTDYPPPILEKLKACESRSHQGGET